MLGKERQEELLSSVDQRRWVGAQVIASMSEHMANPELSKGCLTPPKLGHTVTHTHTHKHTHKHTHARTHTHTCVSDWHGEDKDATADKVLQHIHTHLGTRA